MKKFSFYTLTFILLGIIFSCKKKEYPVSSTDNSPVFYFSGTVGGVPTTITAGLNDYYMYSSYTQDVNNVYGFIGNLKRTTSTTGIQIQINDYKTTVANGYAQIDTALTVADYPFYAGTPGSTSYNVQFNSSFNKPVLGTYWDFGDGYTAINQANPTHTYKKGGKYNVFLRTTDTGFNSDSISDIQKIGIAGCKTMIATSTYTMNTDSFKQFTTGTAPFNYLWNFGDGATSTASNTVHTYTTTGKYNTSLRVIDFNQDTAYASHHLVTTLDTASCATNYTVTSVTPAPNPLAFSNIVITWTDAAGTVYTSNNASQPASSYFKIISVSTYHNNDNNQTVKKLHVKFNCTVYNGGTPLVINNGDAVIVVAYK